MTDEQEQDREDDRTRTGGAAGRAGRQRAARAEPDEAQFEHARNVTVWPPMAFGQPDPDVGLPEPGMPVAQSYRRQSYRLPVDGEDHLLRPAEARRTTDRDDPRTPVHLLSLWHPDGVPTGYRACRGAEVAVRALLAGRGLASEPVVVVAGDLTWFEAGVLLAGLDDREAVALAADLGQPAVVRWDTEVLAVLPTGLRADVPPEQVPWELVPVPTSTCPVRRDADPGGRCAAYGGPWTGSSRAAMMMTQHHRQLAVALLGCAPCRDGREPSWGRYTSGSGRADLDAPDVLSSRYHGMGR